MSRDSHRDRLPSGFTLVELLVVIGIIAILIAILMPALNKARYQAKEVACLSNIRQMALVWHAYAAGNRGKFPPHRSPGPMYVRVDPVNGGTRLDRQSPWYMLEGAYMTDPYITICPFLTGDGSPESDPYFRAGDYGFWASGAPMTLTDYSFTANWVPSGSSPPGTTNPEPYITYYDRERPWPRHSAEASADRAFIFHGVYFHENLVGGWDGGHGSKKGAWNPIVPTDWRQLFTRTAPVGYADGHAEIHVRDFLKRRASYNDPYYGRTDFWY